MKEPYPLDIFPMISKSLMRKYQEMFKKAGLSQDRYSAYCMRIAYKNGYEDAVEELRESVTTRRDKK